MDIAVLREPGPHLGHEVRGAGRVRGRGRVRGCELQVRVRAHRARHGVVRRRARALIGRVRGAHLHRRVGGPARPAGSGEGDGRHQNERPHSA